MNQKIKIIIALLTTIILIASFTATYTFAITEDEVEERVEEVGEDAVTGNIFVWFLCAIAFLKVSQKIDSLMSSLGINVGHTGGSMLSEAMIAIRGFGLAKGIAGAKFSKGTSSGSGNGTNTFKGGLSGIVERKVSTGAVMNANGSKSGGIGGMVFNSSLAKGGGFANSVIGRIATGKISETGTISGKGAADSLLSYMGYTNYEENSDSVPSYSNVEIGGGRIFATEVTEEHPDGIAMGMYNTDQYMMPDGNYEVVTATDGTSWYKQYATEAVEHKPYTNDDGTIGYKDSIVMKLSRSPLRKDSK